MKNKSVNNAWTVALGIIIFVVFCGLSYSVLEKKWEIRHRFYGTASTQEMADKFIGILQEAPDFSRTIHMTSECDSTQAAKIREYFQLDTLFNSDANTWEKTMAIATFVNSNIPSVNQIETPQSKDAISLWEYTKNVEPGFNAAYHSLLTFELLLSVGIEARWINCFPKDEKDNFTMCVNHVWIPELNKWVMLTTCNTSNWVSDTDGTPLSLKELRDSYIHGKEICYRSLSGESNTNHDFFYAYMAKNIYWFSALETERLRQRDLPNKRSTMVALVPVGYNYEFVAKQGDDIVCTYDEEAFWAAPIYENQ